MEINKPEKEKAPFRKGFVAILVLSIAIFGLYNMLLGLLRYIGII